MVRRFVLLAAVSCAAAGCLSFGPPPRSAMMNYLDQKVEKDPNNVAARLQRAKLRLKDKDYAGAASDFDGVVALDGNCAAGYLGRARARFFAVSDRGDWAELVDAVSARDPRGVMADLNRAVALDPACDDGGAFFLRGGIHLLQFRDAEAQADFDEYVRRNPRLADSVQNAVAGWRKKREKADPASVQTLIETSKS
jgi:hypothetical protein